MKYRIVEKKRENSIWYEIECSLLGIIWINPFNGHYSDGEFETYENANKFLQEWLEPTTTKVISKISH